MIVISHLTERRSDSRNEGCCVAREIRPGCGQVFVKTLAAVPRAGKGNLLGT
jgi:hypothetical protein